MCGRRSFSALPIDRPLPKPSRMSPTFDSSFRQPLHNRHDNGLFPSSRTQTISSRCPTRSRPEAPSPARAALRPAQFKASAAAKAAPAATIRDARGRSLLYHRRSPVIHFHAPKHKLLSKIAAHRRTNIILILMRRLGTCRDQRTGARQHVCLRRSVIWGHLSCNSMTKDYRRRTPAMWPPVPEIRLPEYESPPCHK